MIRVEYYADMHLFHYERINIIIINIINTYESRLQSKSIKFAFRMFF